MAEPEGAGIGRREQEVELPEPEAPEQPQSQDSRSEAQDKAGDVPPATPEKSQLSTGLAWVAAAAANGGDTDTRRGSHEGVNGLRTSLEEVSLSGNDAGAPQVPPHGSINPILARQESAVTSPTPSGITGSSSAAASGSAPSMRRSSTAYSTTSTSRGSIAAARKPLLQGVLVISAFESILSSKDARRLPALKASAQRALDILKAPQGTAANANEDRREEVFEPLKLACETKTNALMITALDTIGKLVSYGFFNPPHANLEDSMYHEHEAETSDESFVRDTKSEKLSDTVVDAICDCFIETPSGPAVAALQAAANSATTPDAVNLQIVKALLTLVLQDANGQGLTVHQSSLVSEGLIRANALLIRPTRS